MGARRFWHLACFTSLFILVLSEPCMASIQSIGRITPGFQGAQMDFIDKQGLFLKSNNSDFSFGFIMTDDVTKFLLGIVHTDSSKLIWSANRASPVSNSDKFLFGDNGGLSLSNGGSEIWKVDSDGKEVSALELQDTGNLVLLGTDNSSIWQSFSHPTDTLISNQTFVEGMKLRSNPASSNVSYVLEIKSGDMILSTATSTPQPYWSISKERRATINKNGADITSATISTNSWRFYDQEKELLWQFAFSDDTDFNATWIATLDDDGVISFRKLGARGSDGLSPTKIPDDPCATPLACEPYYLCSNQKCQCPSKLGTSCQMGVVSPCNESMELVSVEDDLGYFAIDFVPPSRSKTNLEACKSSCSSNCSCLGLFFDNSSGNCFLFDWIGSFQSSNLKTPLASYIKVSSNGAGGGSDGSHFPYVVVIVVATVVVIAGLIFVAFRVYKKKKKPPESPPETSEEDNFLESISGMPVRFSYKELQTATSNFSVKLGQGGFGSVYQGTLPDGTRLAVKKLEGIGQGKKEFRAEVSIIGSIHHHHLVRLKGFCAEGTYRLLAYEFMANGSLDKWIFRKNSQDVLLDWDTRYSIALGTAKGLAYLHEDCDARIVHCDIKPENILLDDHFIAKVSDFGLAKLMNREQSHVFTTLRGTRGYLAPEWITNYAISEKSDVYSYGMVLLEIIGGRKNFDQQESSEKSHFPSYAFKMMEEGKLREVLDPKLEMDRNDEKVHRATKVALWCIQEDMALRPSMSRVVQMLEGICQVTQPPMSSPLGSRLYTGFFKSISEEGTSSGPSDCNSDTYMSAVRLSGPR